MKAQSSGLTLIEILVALAIFAVVAAAVLAMFPTIFKVNGQTRADQAVTIGAKQFMEQARAAMDTVTEFDSVTAAASLPAAPDATKSAYQNLRLGAQGEAWPRHWSATSCGS